MNSRRGRNIALAASGTGLLVLLGVLFACRGFIIERWLIHRLGSGDEAARRAAAERLGEMGSWRAVPRLLDIAASDPEIKFIERGIEVNLTGGWIARTEDLDAMPQVWAIAAIARIGKKGIPGHIEALETGSPAARARAAGFLGDLGSEAKSAVPVLLRILSSHRDSNLRAVAAAALAAIDPDSDAVFRKVFEALKDPALGEEVARSLEKSGEKSLPLLIKLLETNDSDAAEFAARALERIGPAAAPAAPALIAKLREGELLSPVPALGRIGAAAVPALVEVVEDREAGRAARLHAISALNNIGPGAAGAVPALIEALGDGDPRVATLASYALARIGRAGEPAAGRLAAALRSHPDRSVRRGAAHALGRIGRDDADFVLALTRALADEDASVRWQAALSLGEIRPEAGGAVEALIAALGDPETSPAAAQALGKIGPAAAPAVEPLSRLLGDADEWARLRAAEALGRLGARAAAAIPRLEAALADEEPKVRAQAEQALLMIRGPGPPAGSRPISGRSRER